MTDTREDGLTGVPSTEQIRQQRIDALKIFLPSAIPYVQQAYREGSDQAFMWHEAFLHAFNALVYTDQALQSLTPGGSEYVHAPDRCVAFVKDRHETMIRRVKSATATNAVAKLVEALNTSQCPRPCVAGDNTVAGCIDAGVCNCGNRAALASFTRTTP